jgi:hypothetical protein
MGSKQALVIGINAYDPRNALPSCVADADAFADLLGKAYGFTRIANLRDQQASHDAMATALTQLVNGATAGDQLVFYYSGHGYSFPKNGVTIEALVPQDEVFFDCDQLAEITNAVPPGVMTVVLDACYSGGMEKAFVHPDGLVEVHRIKSWQPPDSQKGFLAAPRGGTRYKAFSTSRPHPARIGGFSSCQPACPTRPRRHRRRRRTAGLRSRSPSSIASR